MLLEMEFGCLGFVKMTVYICDAKNIVIFKVAYAFKAPYIYVH